MLRFLVKPADGHKLTTELHGAHLYGADGVPVRADVRYADGQIICDAKSQTPLGLSLLWPVAGVGVVQLETTRLPLRREPYHLHLELARHRLMRISLKREEWGLFDYSGMEEISASIDQARDSFVAAMEAQPDVSAVARLSDRSLEQSVLASERMSRFHASVFLGRRHQSGGFSRQFLGAAAPPVANKTALLRRAAEVIDFLRIPMTWRELQPKEQEFRYDNVDEWLKAATPAKMPMRAGPLLNFGVRSVPDWMYIWENDIDSILDYARDHVRRTVQRYAAQVNSWTVVSGLHADAVFPFTFEQIIELTRMAATVTKQTAPRCQVILDITQPFGEYYARNQRTIPPLLYADMIVQSGLPFDAFGLQFLFGIDSEGFHLRDLLQVSALIDRLAQLGKPLHITGVGVPSQPESDAGGIAPGGEWHGPWNEETQANWLEAFIEIAMSKPYVECVCVDALVDGPSAGVAHGGILREDLSPKLAFKRLADIRKRLQSEPQK
ncbi:MAG: endo-1,4-beta-xylanase [Phycisphaerales bacterium]|nr:endo-1,4-beta-xylanase [Phycisphaerales bacterium]